MRTKKILLNSIFSAILQIVILLTGLILPRVYLIIYGSEMNGLLTSITQIISYFNLVEAGLGASLIYSLYKPLAENDYTNINKIVSSGKKEYIKTSAIYMILVVGLSFIYPFFVNGSQISNTTIVLLVLVIGFSGAMEFFTMAKYRVLLTADQKLYVISIASTISTLINFFILVILSYLRVDIVILRLCALLSLVIRSLIFKYYLKRKYPMINYNCDGVKVRKNLRISALIYQFSISAHMSIPIVIVTFLCSLEEVSVYSIYNMVFVGIIGILNIVTSGTSSALGNIIASGEEGKLNKAFDEYELVIYSIIAWIYGCTFILIMPFINVYTLNVSDANYVNSIYGILFTIWGICNTTWMARASLISATGIFDKVKKSNIIQMCGLIVLGLFLTKMYNIAGMLVALIMIAIYRTINTIYVTNKYVIKNQYKNTVKRLINMAIVIFIINLPFMLYITINVSSLLDWFKYAVLVSIWAGIVVLVFLILFEKEAFKSLLNRIKLLI